MTAEKKINWDRMKEEAKHSLDSKKDRSETLIMSVVLDNTVFPFPYLFDSGIENERIILKLKMKE